MAASTEYPATHLSQFLSNKFIEELRTHKKELETEYQEKLESFKPGYPAMVQISNKIKETDKQLASEVNAIRNSLKAAYEGALTQENEMKKHVEELREEVLGLQKKGIQYNILKREVDTNRGLYNSLLQRYKEVDIASGSGTTNIFIADPAVFPDHPSEPNIPRTLLFSLVLGIALGGGVAYLLEILDDRVSGAGGVGAVRGDRRPWGDPRGRCEHGGGAERPALLSQRSAPVAWNRTAILHRIRVAAIHLDYKLRPRGG